MLIVGFANHGGRLVRGLQPQSFLILAHFLQRKPRPDNRTLKNRE